MPWSAKDWAYRRRALKREEAKHGCFVQLLALVLFGAALYYIGKVMGEWLHLW
ncbi:MAG: hypothetical protein KDB29_13945 [Planctomycetes bacterium]|nr:hypothetical protein [Planctomycetota bacterium]